MEGNPAHILERFPVTGELSRLPGEVDHNFKVVGPEGTFVLRLSPSDSEDGLFDFQEQLLFALEALDLETPHLVPTTAGERLLRLDEGFAARLFTWVKGDSYSNIGRPPEAARHVGELAGTLVKSLEGWSHPGAGRIVDWDLCRAHETISRHSAAIQDDARRALIKSIARRLESLDVSRFPIQIIHNDLNDDNVLFETGQIVGLIDIGDALESIRISEAVVAATYTMLGQHDPVSVGVEALQGFSSCVEVTRDEASAVLELIFARLAISVCLSASRGPTNPYHQRSEDLAWELLLRLDAASREGMGAELSTALGHRVEPQYPELAPRRRSLLGPSLSLSYETPLHIVRGAGSYLFDHRGRSYLDAVNNVAHVGHTHPTVVATASRQMGLLNTNTRYLHEEILRYAERLAATLPDTLDVVFLVNSGSEANELAIRMARTATARHGVLCVEHGYHGNTSTLVDVSHYKFAGLGGSGERPWVTTLPSPDPFRNPAFSGPEAVHNYAAAMAANLARAELDPALLITETLGGVAGQIVPESGVLEAMYAAARALGALVIADEVQTGLGRVGAAMWAFQLYDVIPDIVTMGKPLGNGHPLGAVVTTHEIAAAFENGMEYFNTFGGNPVSAAVGNAVLDVMDGEKLQINASKVGGYIIRLLSDIAEQDARVGDIRGRGLFLGIEIVEAGDSRRPDPKLARYLVEHAKDHGVLLSVDGPHHNVIKIKPPLVFDATDAEFLAQALHQGLQSSQ